MGVHLKTFSPYHLLRDGVDYPETFIWTATSDDRVGPVQARKMAARMQAMGIPNVWFHEALEGGHAGASDNRQAAALQSRSQHFLWRALAGRAPEPRRPSNAGSLAPIRRPAWAGCDPAMSGRPFCTAWHLLRILGWLVIAIGDVPERPNGLHC